MSAYRSSLDPPAVMPRTRNRCVNRKRAKAGSTDISPARARVGSEIDCDDTAVGLNAEVAVMRVWSPTWRG